MDDHPKSGFVTATGILSMLNAGFLTVLAGIVTFFMLSIVAVNGKDLSTAATEFAATNDVGPYLDFVLRNLQTIIIGTFCLSAFWLVTSGCLLARKNWARLVSVVFFALFAVASAGALWLLFSLMNSLPQEIEEIAERDASLNILALKIAVAILACCGISAWTSWKLTTAEIKREFTREPV